MKLSPPSDIWRMGVLPMPLEKAAFLPTTQWPQPIAWLEQEKSFSFLGDPFGLVRGDSIYLFAEAYDYRNKRGYIDALILDASGKLREQKTVLREPWHLSYPIVFEHEGEFYMLPEAHRSGKLTLYRARNFPNTWEKAHVILDKPVIDASILQHEGRWWLFYSLPDAPFSALHVAYCNDLFGNWQPHPMNPVMQGMDRARPGGKPFVKDGSVYLPVQDNRNGYGSALNLLHIETLNPTAFSATIVHTLQAGSWSAPYSDGLHTLSGSGDFTFFDVKRIHRSPKRHIVNWQRRIRRILNYKG